MFRKIALLLCVFFCLLGCTTDPAIYGKIDAAMALMEDRPDSALSILRSIDPDSLSDKESLARYQLYLSQALDKNRIFVKSDSLIGPALEYFNLYGNNTEKMLANNYYGRMLIYSDQLDLAIPFLLEAEKYASAINDHEQLGLIYDRIGHIHDREMNYEQAELFYTQSVESFEKAGKKVQAIQGLRGLARLKAKTKDYDKAIEHYNESRKRAYEIGDTAMILYAYQQIAFLYINNLDDTQMARRALNEAQSYARDEKLPVSFYATLSIYYTKTEKYDSARYFADRYLESVYANPNLRSAAYVMLQRIEEGDKQYQQALRYREKSSTIRDSLIEVQRKKNIFEIEQKYQNDIVTKENELLRREKSLLYLVAGLLFIILIILILASHYLRKQAAKRKDREIEEYRNYIESLQEDNVTLQDLEKTLAAQLDTKNENEKSLILSLENRFAQISEILDIATVTENNKEQFYRKMKESINRLREEDSFSDGLQKVVNNKYFGIIDYLKTTFPTLSKDDLDFISLCSLGVSRNSISTLYGYTNLNSVHTRSARLRSKLFLDKSVHLNNYIQELINTLAEEKE